MSVPNPGDKQTTAAQPAPLDATRLVSTIVLATHRSVRALRLAEATLWSLAVGLAVLATVASVGERGFQRDGFVLAGVLALVTLATVATVTVPRLAQTARKLDRDHGRRFGLVAAFEREQAARPTELDALLSQRVRQRLDSARVASGYAATVVPAVVAPLLATAWLGLSVGPVASAPLAPAQLAEQAAEELSRALTNAGDEVGAAERSEFAQLIGALRAAAREADRSPEAAARLEELQRELAERVARLAPDGELARASERAALKLGAAERRTRAAIEPADRAASSDGAASAGAGDGSKGVAPTGLGTGETGDSGTAGDAQDPHGSGADAVAGEVESAARLAGWLEPSERALVEAWNEARRLRALERTPSTISGERR